MAETKNAPKGAAGAQPAKAGEAAAAKSGPAAANGEATAKAPKAKITKMDAVRRTLANLGKDALPSEMKPYIKTTFGIEMTTDHISTYKGDIARKAREAAEAAQRGASAKKPAAPKPQAAPKQQTPAVSSAPHPKARRAQAASGNGSVGGNILLEDVLTTKQLLDRVGAEKLRTLIDGLAK